MTFAIAEIFFDEGGRITLLADTKLTDDSDVAATRSIYTNPMLKVVIVDDDVAVAVAGNWPRSSIERAVALRGSTPAEMIEHLRQFSEDVSRASGSPKSFLIAKRAPEPRLFRIRHGDVDEASSAAPRLWIGDRAGFSAFQSAYHQQIPNESAERRLVVATQTAVMLGEVSSVGGYVTRATGSVGYPFRFRSDPCGTGPWETEGNIVERDGRPVLAMRVPQGVDPSEHTRIGVPGCDDTFGAMAFYSPETKTARLWLHHAPSEAPVQLTGVASIPELVQRAAQEYGQKLASVNRVSLADAPLDTALFRESPTPLGITICDSAQ